MAIIVIDKTEGIVVVFGGKAEGVFEVEVTVRDGRVVDDTGDSSKGGVVVVCSNAIARFKVNQFRDVLVPVKGVEEFVVAGVGDHKERARGHGFSRVPNEEIYLRIVVNKAMEFSHAKPLRQLYLC